MVTLRELLKLSSYDATVVIFGVDAAGEDTLRRGRQLLGNVTPLFKGGVGYAVLGFDIEDYLDRKVLRFDMRGEKLVVYQRLLETREEIENGNGISDVADAGAPVPAGG